MKKTLLNEFHKNNGAKLIEFAGWEMPIQYTSIIEEHNSVRNNVGLFDVSHMGTFLVNGKNSLEFLQKVTTSNIGKIKKGKAIYTQFCNYEGGIIDDLIIYQVDNNDYYLVVNASNVEKDFNWLKNNLIDNVSLLNISDNTSIFALQGPNSFKIIEEYTNLDLSNIKKFNLFVHNYNNVDYIISRTGYTGEDGFEIIVNNSIAIDVWNKIIAIGKKFDLKLIGLGARDTLRLEAALPLYSNELDEKTSPIEAGLSWCIDFSKNFIGKDVLLKQKENGTNKKLIGIKALSKVILRNTYELFQEGNYIGRITSGIYSPTLNYSIALAYINVNNSKKCENTYKLSVKIRNNFYDVEVVNLPFYSRNRRV
ncbi:MAG: aminomethyltransferase [Candidatus Sericytochromatia bacterium]|nr:MAG: aminomethyltransferase [Candidatus Sericytochromatia bacterium]